MLIWQIGVGIAGIFIMKVSGAMKFWAYDSAWAKTLKAD
jgi:hypothetical protein